MRSGRHSTVTDAQRKELWRRYKAGETILGIGRALSQGPNNLYRVLEATGGIAPAQRSRSPRVLSFGEREEISRGIAAGTHSAPSPGGSSVQFPRSVRRWQDMEDGAIIVPLRLTGRPGSGHVVPSSVCLPATNSCNRSLRLN